MHDQSISYCGKIKKKLGHDPRKYLSIVTTKFGDKRNTLVNGDARNIGMLGLSEFFFDSGGSKFGYEINE